MADVWLRIAEDPANLLTSIMGAFSTVTETDFIFIIESTMADIFRKLDCDLIIAKETFMPKDMAFPVRKDFPYTEMMNGVWVYLL